MKQETITRIESELRSALYQAKHWGFANHESRKQNIEEIKSAMEDFANFTNLT